MIWVEVQANLHIHSYDHISVYLHAKRSFVFLCRYAVLILSQPIHRPLNKPFQTSIYPNLADPSGIDLDVIRRQVYWVDEESKTINVINMDLTGQAVIIEGGLDEPRALTVNPLTG